MSTKVSICNSLTTSVGVFMVRNGCKSTDMDLSNYIGRSNQGT